MGVTKVAANQPAWTEYFWDLAMVGYGSTDVVDGTVYTTIIVESDDRTLYPELDTRYVHVWRDADYNLYGRPGRYSKEEHG